MVRRSPCLDTLVCAQGGLPGSRLYLVYMLKYKCTMRAPRIYPPCGRYANFFSKRTSLKVRT